MIINLPTMRLITIFAFLMLFITGRPVHADFIPESEKEVSGFVNIEGWENTKDFVLIQPTFAWDYCNGNPNAEITFVILNDGHMRDFGFESHSSSYYGLAALKTKDANDIKIVSSSTDKPRSNLYKIACSSEAYKNALFTNKEIPYGDYLVKKDENIQRVDFTISLKDFADEIMFDVSNPILRTSLSTNDAMEFENGLELEQKIAASAMVCATPKDTLNNEVTKCNTIPMEPVEKNTTLVPQALYYTAAVSVALLTGVVGFVVGKKTSTLEATNTNDLKL